MILININIILIERRRINCKEICKKVALYFNFTKTQKLEMSNASCVYNPF